MLDRRGLLLCIPWLVAFSAAYLRLENSKSTLTSHDAMAQIVLAQENQKPVWVEGIQDPSTAPVYPGAIVLSAWLHDRKRQFSSSPRDSKILFFSFQPSPATGFYKWSSSAFDTIELAEPWIDQQRSGGKEIGGGHDWAVRLHPANRVDSHID